MNYKMMPKKLLISLKEQARVLFKRRCIICGTPSGEVHEIIPISRGRITYNLDNMVVLCRKHHREIHDKGINDRTIEYLQRKRAEWLAKQNENKQKR